MSDTAFYITDIAMALIFLRVMWALRTATRQRNPLIHAIYKEPDWHELASEFHETPLELHAFFLAIGRNPATLYPARLWWLGQNLESAELEGSE